MQRLNKNAWIFLSKQRGFLWGDVIRIHYEKFYIDVKLAKNVIIKMKDYVFVAKENKFIMETDEKLGCPSIRVELYDHDEWNSKPPKSYIDRDTGVSVCLLIPKELAPKNYKPKLVHVRNK